MCEHSKILVVHCVPNIVWCWQMYGKFLKAAVISSLNSRKIKNRKDSKFFFTITSSKFVCRWATHGWTSNLAKMNDFCMLLIVRLIRYTISAFSSSSPELLFKSNAFECQDACYCPPTCMLLFTNGMVITAQVMPFVAFWSCFGIKKQTLIPLRIHVRWVRAYLFFLFR